MHEDDLLRELQKMGDALWAARRYFEHQSNMNAKLHMSDNVRMTPLGVAVSNAAESATDLYDRLAQRGTTIVITEGGS